MLFLVIQSCLTLCDPMDNSLPSSLPQGFSRQEYSSGLSCPPPGDLPNPGIKPRCLALQADSLPSEPTGKPKNTGVGSLFLLQGIFLIQEANQGLLHGRQILYQLSYQGSSIKIISNYKDNKIFLKHKNSAKVPYHEPLKKALIDGISQLKKEWINYCIRTSRCSNWIYKRQRNQRSNCQHQLDH